VADPEDVREGRPDPTFPGTYRHIGLRVARYVVGLEGAQFDNIPNFIAPNTVQTILHVTSNQ